MTHEEAMSLEEIVDKAKKNPEILESLSPMNRAIVNRLCRELDEAGEGGV